MNDFAGQTSVAPAAGAFFADRGVAKRPRLAVVVSHPIQYYTPYYRAIAAEGSVHIKAFFCSRIGLGEAVDEKLGVAIKWNTDLLGGYDHEFLPEAPTVKTTRFWDVNNPSVVSRLEDYQPDVVLIHGYAHNTLIRTIMWCRRRGVPLMNISDRSLFGRTTPLRRAARRVVLPLILKQYKAFLVIGDSVHKFYATFGARDEQIFRVPNMLDDGFWSARAHRSETRRKLREKLGLGDEMLVLCVGKLIPLKRPQDLLQALAILRDRPTRRPVRVLFVGDGQMRAELEARARNENLLAQIAGFVNIDELPAYYCAGDVLAHPSENECYGTVVLEAAALGLPLVVSDRVGAVGLTSIARPGENALLYPCQNSTALAKMLERLANEPETCARMSEASLRFSKDHMGEMSVTNTITAIDYCLATRGRV